MNPWETLGVSKEASEEEIKRAWRKKAMLFHPDRGGDVERFKDALFAYEALSGRWQASSASWGSQSGQEGQRQAGETFERNDEFTQYAQAYYDAWYSVPDKIRFWFAFFKLLHGASLLFARPLFFVGGLLLIAALLFGKPPKEAMIRTFVIVALSSVPILAVRIGFWEGLRVDLQDKYSFRRARESVRKALVWKEKAASQNHGFAQRRSETRTPNSAPDMKGVAAGCAVVLTIILGMTIFGVLT
jgi:DnaJ domain